MLLHFNKVQLQFPGVFTKAVILVKSCFMRPDFDDEGGTKPFAINLHKNAIFAKKISIWKQNHLMRPSKHCGHI